ncbi:MAG: peptidoglycan-binding protein [Gemmataceae bacterium]|nr:peptidoglycan-binding protein [Gemmataceae bacterium]MCI0742702.1 peptidoglycan-binding protein [Gemmataceae bacterium]
MLGQPRVITGSVGVKGRNVPADTDVVQELLNIAPPAEGGPQPVLKVDGFVGPKTTAAIQRFQVQRFGWSGADGRIDPDQRTFRWLKVMEGQYGRQQFKIIKTELAGGVHGVSDAYFAIMAVGMSAMYSLGRQPEPNPAHIVQHLTFPSDLLTAFRTFQTQTPRGARSFETKSATETIFPDPGDPARSLIFLHLDFPRADLATRTDFIDIGWSHRWVDLARKPAGFHATQGAFHVLAAHFG